MEFYKDLWQLVCNVNCWCS